MGYNPNIISHLLTSWDIQVEEVIPSYPEWLVESLFAAEKSSSLSGKNCEYPAARRDRWTDTPEQ